MRTLISGARAVISAAAGHWCFAYLDVTNDAGSFVNCGQLAGAEGTNDFFVSAQLADSIDANTITFSAVLKREVGIDSLSPFRIDSPLNVSEDTPGTFAPALDLHRQWRIMVAVTARGTTPGPTDYREMAAGRVDKITVDGLAGTITIEGRGLEADLLDAFVVEDRAYDDAMETVIQSALDDQMGVNVVPLYTPVSPSFVVQDTIGDINLMPALSDIAALTGWSLRYRYDASDVNRLTLFEPPRDTVVPDWTIADTEYEDLTAAIDLSNVRNYIKVRYQDATAGVTTVVSPGAESGTVTCVSQTATFSADQSSVIADGAILVINDVGYTVSAFNGSTTCTLVGAPDFADEVFYTSASITKYGVRTFVADLAATTQITDSTAAGNLADAMRSDLEDPALMQSFKAPGLWFVQLHDVVTTSANGVHYSDDQTGGVVSYAHTFANGMLETTVDLAGRPRGRYTTWKRIGSGNGASTETTAPSITSSSATFRETLVGVVTTLTVDVVCTVNDQTRSVEVWLYEDSALTSLADFESFDASSAAPLVFSLSGTAGLDRDIVYYAKLIPYSGPLAMTGGVTGTAGVYAVANTGTLRAPTDTATVEWDLSTPGQLKANVVIGGDSEVAGAASAVTTVPFFDEASDEVVFTLIPNALTEQTTRLRRAAMLSGMGAARLVANVRTAPSGNEVVRVGYAVDGTTFTEITGGDLVLSIAGVVRGDWFTVPDAMAGDVDLRIVTLQGDGTRTARLSSLALQASPTSRTGGATTPPVGGGGGGSGATIWDDNFDTGSSIDTAGTRFTGAKPWTLLNEGSSSFTVTGGQLVLTPALSAFGMTPRAAVEDGLPSGDWTFETKLVTQCPSNYAGAGMILRESSSGKILSFGVANDFGFKYQVRRQPSGFNTWASNYGGTGTTLGIAQWLRISRSGANLVFDYSTDGTSFTTLTTVAQTDDFTTAPDQIGLWANGRTAVGATEEVATFDYFHKTA